MENKYHYILAALLGVAGLLILLIFVSLKSKADDTNSGTTTVGVTNSAPTIDTFSVSFVAQDAGEVVNDGTANIQNEGTVTTVYFDGTYTDLNGCGEVDNGGEGRLSGWLYSSQQGVENDCILSQNPANCYSIGVSSCDFSGCSTELDTTGIFHCSSSIQYYARSTGAGGVDTADHWYTHVIINDGHDLNEPSTWSATSTINDFQLAPFAAIEVSGSSVVNYGTLALGAESTPQQIVVENTGNTTNQDVGVKGSAMTCTTGTIATLYQGFSASSSATYANRTHMQTSTTQSSMASEPLNIATQSGPSTNNIYFSLLMPTPTTADPIKGSCNGTIYLVAENF